VSAEIEKIKTELILKPLNSKEELRDWMYTFFGLKFPMGVVYPTSTHGPIDAAWRIYELMKTGQSQDVPEVVLLSSRDSYKTLIASAIEVLCLVHFEISIAHAAAILSQSEKAVTYANSFFNKISPYLVANGWEKTSDNKTKIEWRTNKGETIYLRVLVMTRKGMNCVLGSTKIRTDKGAMSASDIYKRIIDGESFKFLSFNHSKEVLEYKDVVCTQKNKHKITYQIETPKGTIEVSPDHKVYVKDVGYVKAKDLKEGQTILRVKGDRSYLTEKHGRRTNLQQIKEKIQKYTNVSLLSEVYQNNNQLLDFSCKEHGSFSRKWSKTYDRIKKGLNPCQKCNQQMAIKKQTLSNDNVQDIVNQNGFQLLSIDHYNTAVDSKLKILCPQKHVFHINYNNFNNNRSCTKCSAVYSKSQKEIYDYIQSIYKKEIIINDRNTIKPLELDIYVPEKNFGIEFDGLYWHSEKVKPNIKSVNIQKANAIKQKNIKVLVIFEDEWKNEKKQKLIKAMIRYRLGLKPEKKLRASKLELVKLVKNNDFKLFFDENHIDGHVNSSFAYALLYNSKIVSCMSFRKSIHDKEWEISRFATDYNFVVYGNASKLVAEFEREYKKPLITYSNNRLSLGSVYEKLGFKDVTQTTTPSYYYTDFSVRLWRFKCRKINTPDIVSIFPTEKLQAEGGVFSQKYLGHNKPLYKIYDYGHRKWIKK
jgi:hypothetical protein